MSKFNASITKLSFFRLIKRLRLPTCKIIEALATKKNLSSVLISRNINKTHEYAIYTTQTRWPCPPRHLKTEAWRSANTGIYASWHLWHGKGHVAIRPKRN